MKAAILAGGLSKRFGENKLLQVVNGKPLLEYTIDNLKSTKNINSIYLVARERQIEELDSFGIPILIDNFAVGPLGGIYVALRNLGDVLVVAGDMPLVPSEFFDILIDKFLGRKCEVVIPAHRDIMAIFPMVVSSNLEKAAIEFVNEGILSVRRFLSATKTCFVDVSNRFKKHIFLNINTREDLARFSSFLEKNEKFI